MIAMILIAVFLTRISPCFRYGSSIPPQRDFVNKKSARNRTMRSPCIVFNDTVCKVYIPLPRPHSWSLASGFSCYCTLLLNDISNRFLESIPLVLGFLCFLHRALIPTHPSSRSRQNLCARVRFRRSRSAAPIVHLRYPQINFQSLQNTILILRQTPPNSRPSQAKSRMTKAQTTSSQPKEIVLFFSFFPLNILFEFIITPLGVICQ